MTEQSDNFDIDGVQVRRSREDPSIFYYIPGEPTPERDAQGRPTLLLWVSDQGARLQLGARWTVDPDQLARLQAAIAQRFPDPQSPPQLRPAPISVKQVDLALGDGQGTFETLQTSTSSGFIPFAAIFAVPLTAEQKERAGAALNGRAEFLKVVYHGMRSIDVAVKATIAGDVGADLDQIGRAPTLEECLARIDLAIEQGRLAFEESGDDTAPAELWEQARRMAREKAARALQRMAGGATVTRWSGSYSNASTLTAAVSLGDTVLLPIERTADISSWFPAGGGADHIRPMSGTPPGPRPPADGGGSIRLGFDPQGAPVAFVELARGAARATLRGPGFAAATLPANAEGPLRVKTHYTASGAPYETTLDTPGPQGWALTLADLGLAKVVVDGAGPRQAGAREARVRVRYLPTGAGADDDRTIYLRRDQWMASWYLITRAPGLGGALEVEWKETTASGAAIMHPRARLETTEIKL